MEWTGEADNGPVFMDSVGCKRVSVTARDADLTRPRGGNHQMMMDTSQKSHTVHF